MITKDRRVRFLTELLNGVKACLLQYIQYRSNFTSIKNELLNIIHVRL